MTDKPIGHGTVLAGRFRLEDLVQNTDGAKFWRAIDQILARNVAVNVLETTDPRADALLVAARTSATITEGHFLRVLDAAQEDGVVYVVHEWGSGMSLDQMLDEGPLPSRRAAWLVKEVADAITFAHSHGIAHGRLVPENVMVTDTGSVKLIGFVVDAVLHGPRQPDTADGRSISDHESDVHNLAALLYATLVAKWPGTQASLLPSAPRDHERTLRPRQVRAGVPRALDAICDRVLNPGSAHGSLETAHEISAALSDYIGDPAAAPPVEHEPTAVIDTGAMPGFGQSTGAQPVAGSSEDPEATQAAPPSGAGQGSGRAAGAWPVAGVGSAAPPGQPSGQSGVRATTDPEATQAAPPMFHEGDQERTRRVSPPPPPPLPEPEAKPLFAPGPPRASVERYDSGADEPSGPVRGFHSTHGTGSLPAVWGPDARPDTDDEGWQPRDTGRDWLKLAAAIGVLALLVVAVIVSFNLGRGSGDDPSAEPTDESGSKSSAPAGPVSVAAISDLDPPPSGNGEENGELARLAVDGNPATAWQTMTYYGNPKFGLLKDGVGLVVDLGKENEVSSVQVTVQGSPTNLEVFAAPKGSSQPSGVENLQRVGAADGVDGRTDVAFDEPVTTRYLVVWLTSLPPGGGGYKGRISEIVVRR